MVSDGRRIDSPGNLLSPNSKLLFSLQNISDLLPMCQIPAVKQRNTWCICKTGCYQIEIFSYPADRRVRIKSRQNRILNCNHSFSPLLHISKSENRKFLIQILTAHLDSHGMCCRFLLLKYEHRITVQPVIDMWICCEPEFPIHQHIRCPGIHLAGILKYQK